MEHSQTIEEVSSLEGRRQEKIPNWAETRPQLAVTLADFNAGIRYWRTTGWPLDFHNNDYNSLAAQNPNGNFSPPWWAATLRRLHQWKATRPVAGATITARFNQFQTALQQAWVTSCAPVISSDLSVVPWHQVQPFTDLVSQLKPDTSMPVLTSKFCHFLMPRVFPVVDGKAMGVYWPQYEHHYNLAQQEWNATASVDQDILRQLMVVEIQASGQQVSPHFPMENKIVELALIGRFHP